MKIQTLHCDYCFKNLKILTDKCFLPVYVPLTSGFGLLFANKKQRSGIYRTQGWYPSADPPDGTITYLLSTNVILEIIKHKYYRLKMHRHNIPQNYREGDFFEEKWG